MGGSLGPGIRLQEKCHRDGSPRLEPIQDPYTDAPSAYTAPEKQKATEGWPKCLIRVVGGGRLELPTNGLKVRCSTN